MKAMIEFDMPTACAWCPIYFRVCRVMSFKAWMKYDSEQEDHLWVRERRHPKCPLKPSGAAELVDYDKDEPAREYKRGKVDVVLSEYPSED